MIENVIDSIKGPRRMTLDHWRFRLLHWCFDVRSPDPEKGRLPRYLYTHFCPLFHLTNLIALLSPFILAFKVIVGTLRLGLHAARFILAKISPPRAPLTDEEKREALRLSDAKRIHQLSDAHPDREFDSVWFLIEDNVELHDKAAASVVFALHRLRIERARIAAQKRRDAFRERVLLWVNFSHVFVKAGLFALYVLGALFIGYILWRFGAAFARGVLDCLAFIWSGMFTVDALILVVWLGLAAFGGLGLVVGFKRLAPLIKEPVRNNLGPALVPVTVCRDCIGDLWAATWRALGNTRDFVAVFFEENCPAIRIVEKDEPTEN